MSTKRGRTNLKVYKEPSWQLETTGVDGNATLFGVNIFDYEWRSIGKKARIVSPLDGSVDLLPIFSVLIDDKEHKFVCEEQSNCVYNFFVYKY